LITYFEIESKLLEAKNASKIQNYHTD